ncbi:MAG TPA: carbamoyltransferase C-terminal domain-containing protein [Gemmatimonadaceae bacterium]|nr:carbamoyltransferase C-terminal domain-containing protein [Gemmatimonadaceae bacterium]
MNSATYILGINAYHADGSAVLVRDGELVVALEEERFRRIKHWAGFPAETIRKCLEIGGIDGSQISHVAVSRDPRANLLRKAAFAFSNRMKISNIVNRTRNLKKVHDIQTPLAEALGLSESGLPPLHFVEHHPSHLASTFFVSPFEDAAICAIDGFGDFISTSTAVGRGNQIRMLGKVSYPHSLGVLYTAVTQHLGFANYGDEFKVMGLAPYGSPEYVDEVRRLVTLKPGGGFELTRKYFRHWDEGVEMDWEGGSPTMGPLYTPELSRIVGPPRAPGQPLEPKHENLARSVQAVYEECAFHVLNGLWSATGNPRLCMAGGCAMNSVANGKIRENTRFEEVYIQPASADSGTALGAAYQVWNQILKKPRGFTMVHAYWGTAYPNADVSEIVRSRSDGAWRYTCETLREDELLDRTARLIADGNVVGWYQGRMEWGARALGNRSILADARRADMRELINTKIKFREKFRPFAPSILEEAMHDYFVGAATDPFMQQVYPVRPEKRDILPAVTHVDGSGRLQTVRRDTNPRYYKLIAAFAEITGVPVVLNTSFNENEPIVDTPEQALDCFFRTTMDAIVVNDVVVVRHPAGEKTMDSASTG